LRSADALLPTVSDRITAATLAVEPLRTRILANYGVGFNHIDVAAVKARGVVVTNTPEVLTDDTADDAIMLMLMVARRAGEGERQGARVDRTGSDRPGSGAPRPSRVRDARGVSRPVSAPRRGRRRARRRAKGHRGGRAAGG